MGINKWKLSAICTASLLCVNLSYAERSGFYTIIGPDGRVMVIDRSASEAKNIKTSKQKLDQRIASSSKITNASNVIKVPLDQRGSVNIKAEKPATEAVLKAQPQATQPLIIKRESLQSSVLSNKDLQQQASKVPVKVANQVTSNNTIAPSDKVKEVQVLANTRHPLEGSQAAVNPVTTIDGEQYVDSEYLEEHEFNLEGKKRFYNLPDGLGGNQTLEREKGVDMSVFRRFKAEQPHQQVVTLSKNYQRIAKEKVVELIGIECFSAKQLKKAKQLHKGEGLNLWPRPGFEPKFDFVVARLPEQINDIQFTSYADKISNPQFYWPLPVFLDNQGCVIEGVNAFYQQTIEPTGTTHQALQGYLHIPADTRYLLLTPLEAAADLIQIQLTNKGQVRLTPLR